MGETEREPQAGAGGRGGHEGTETKVKRGEKTYFGFKRNPAPIRFWNIQWLF